jgi:acetyl-CoA acetyltransferase
MVVGSGRRPCIVGLGQTEFSRRSGRPELELALEAIAAAIADAGLDVADIDGLVRYTWDSSGEAAVVAALGLRHVSYYSEVEYGGVNACATLSHAAAAIDAGLASCIVVYRSLNARSGTRFGRGERHLVVHGDEGIVVSRELPADEFTAPFGLLAPPHVHALYARRYFAQYGITDEVGTAMLGSVAVTQRAYANKNPRALFHDRKLSMAEYEGSPMMAAPLRLHDLCLETDGAMAIVIVSPLLASRLPSRAVEILAATQAVQAHSIPMALYGESLHSLAPEHAAPALFQRAGVEAADIDVAQIYDATSILVPIALEDFGFIERGEAADFLISGGNDTGGRLPVNTHGGLLSEGYFHGLNTIGEAVRQLRGESPNQVADARLAFITVRGASSAILGRS